MDAEKNTEPEIQLEHVVLTEVMRMNATINGIVAGLLIGFIIMLATLWLVIKGGEVVGPHLGLLDQYFWGYSVTFGGSFIGFLYGFAVGFAIGYFVSWIYNLLVDLRVKWRRRWAKRKQSASTSKPDYNPVAPSPLYTASPKRNAKGD